MSGRRRIAVAVTSGLAIAAFAFGARLGDGSGPTSGPASRLPLAQLAGQRVVAGFAGRGAPPALRKMIRRGELAGVILFSANVSGRAGARRLVRHLQAIPRPSGLRDPLLIMVDQEGGLVKRLPGPPTVSAEEMGRRGPAFSRRQGRATASSLHDVGIGIDLAPVLDVARPGGTIAETERGFGSTASRVAATAVPFAEGLQREGVAATAKHFPGLGAAAGNTDFAVQRIDLSRRTLRAVDETPYRRFVERGGAIVMLSTAIYPAFSPKPAAFARPIATGELRARLGFEGVSITDALESAAVRAFGGSAKASVAAARAGTDLLLFADYRAASRGRRALVNRLRGGGLDRVGFERSVERTLELRRQLVAGP